MGLPSSQTTRSWPADCLSPLGKGTRGTKDIKDTKDTKDTWNERYSARSRQTPRPSAARRQAGYHAPGNLQISSETKSLLRSFSYTIHGTFRAANDFPSQDQYLF
jgi:hypothetical protein